MHFREISLHTSETPGRSGTVTWFEEHLQELSSAALRYAVRAVRQPYIDTASVRLDEVETLCVEMIKGSEDTLEGLNAFIEKRRPQWVHR